VSGVDLATVLFDLSPVPPERTEVPEWTPHPEPSQAQLIAEGVKGLARWPVEIGRGAVEAAFHPEKTAGRVREVAESVGEVVWAGLNPAPETPLNVPIGSHRRIVWVETELEQFKAIKNSLGGTVNDVVLAVVTGALARWLRTRGVRTEGLELRAQVPVSIRSDDERDRLGNRIAAIRAPLPVYARDPIERLRIVRESMQGLKESKQALAAQMITGLEGFAPPTLLSMAARTHWSPRLFNMIVTNVPGPQFPIYFQGRELLELVPVAFLPDNFALTIAAMSYNGKLDFSLLGDYDAMPDIDLIGEYVEESLEELLVSAGRPPSGPRNRGRTSRPRSSAQESTVG
jgi:diacylglycerol O-acyltransferase / wax synthase